MKTAAYYTYHFTVNDKKYGTDKDTIELLRQYKQAQNDAMFTTVFEAGVSAGRIKEINN